MGGPPRVRALANGRSRLPLPDGQQGPAVHSGVGDLVRPRQPDLEQGVIGGLRADEALADEVTAALEAHLAGLGETDLDDLAVTIRAHLAQEEVALLTESGVLPPEHAEHEAILPFAHTTAFLRQADLIRDRPRANMAPAPNGRVRPYPLLADVTPAPGRLCSASHGAHRRGNRNSHQGGSSRPESRGARGVPHRDGLRAGGRGAGPAGGRPHLPPEGPAAR